MEQEMHRPRLLAGLRIKEKGGFFNTFLTMSCVLPHIRSQNSKQTQMVKSGETNRPCKHLQTSWETKKMHPATLSPAFGDYLFIFTLNDESAIDRDYQNVVPAPV